MNENTNQPSIQEIQLELAQTRTSAALDRTLLAWIRTALTLIGFGFTLAKFVRDLIVKGYLHGIKPEYPEQLGVGMMILGVAGLLAGAWDYARSVKRLKSATYLPTFSASLVVSLVLAVLSILLTVMLVAHLREP